MLAHCKKLSLQQLIAVIVSKRLLVCQHIYMAHWCLHLTENTPVLISHNDLSRKQYGVHQLLSNLLQSPNPLQPNSTWGVEVYTPQRGRREALKSMNKVSPCQTRT